MAERDRVEVRDSARESNAATASGDDAASHGLGVFFRELGFRPGLHILDLGALSGSTSLVIGRRGHHVHFADLASPCDLALQESAAAEGSASLFGADRMVREVLGYPNRTFDGVLAWNVLQQLEPVAMRAALDQILRVTRPSAPMHCVYQDVGPGGAPALRCELVSHELMRARPIADRNLSTGYTLKGLESIYSQFRYLCLFLRRRNGLQELIVAS